MIDEKKTPKRVILYRYIPGNTYLTGIPRRDLTVPEFEKLSAADRERVLKSGIYEQELEK